MKKTRIKNIILCAITFIAMNAAFISFLAMFMNKNLYISGAVCFVSAAWIALIVYANLGGFYE